MKTICLARPARSVRRSPLGASILALLTMATLGQTTAHALELFWRTDGTTGGTWTSTFWNPGSANATGGTGYTSAATTNVSFTADSSLTYVTSQIFGNVTVGAGATVTITQAGTASAAAHTFDVGTGATLNWPSQNYTAAGTSFVKNGAGIWNLAAISNAFTGGFTLNAGTVIVSGNNSFGNSTLNINGGTIQSSGTRAYAPTSIIVGGDFEQTGTGNATFAATVNLGAATRTLTNNTTSGSRIFSGIISGGAGTGLTFAGSGAGQIYIGNASNSFGGAISITGGEVGFANDGSLGTGTSIVIDGGRLTSATTAGGAVTSVWSSSRNIQVGDTAGTSISVQSGTGDLTYNGVISNVTGKTGAWAKQGAGILHLGGASTYTGATAVNNGTVQITTGNDRLPTGTTLSLGQAASTNLGTFDLNGLNQQVAGLNSTTGTNAGASKNTVTAATGASTLTLGGSGTYSYGDGTAADSGVITGAVSLVKKGSGTQALGDANIYTGTTGVQEGKLLVSGSITGSTVTVAPTTAVTATLASSGGTNSLAPTAASGNAVTIGGGVGGSTARLAPGDVGTIGTINFTLAGTARMAFAANSELNFDISGATSDTVSFASAGDWLTGGGTAVLSLSGLTLADYGNTYTVFHNVSTTGFTFANITGYDSGFAPVFGQSGNDYTLSFVAVPEPSTVPFLVFGTSVLIGFRRFRRTLRTGLSR